MHEMSVVLNVVHTVDAFAQANGIGKIGTVVMQIGKASGVVPFYFHSCWEPASASSEHLFGSSLDIEELPAICRCPDCGAVYELKDAQTRACPKCGSDRWQVISGNEVMIKEILVDEGGSNQ